MSIYLIEKLTDEGWAPSLTHKPFSTRTEADLYVADAERGSHKKYRVAEYVRTEE
jgi:hypothetical protein